RRMRHAHMVNINRQIMMEGMRADFHRVDRISTRVLELVARATGARAPGRQRSGGRPRSELSVVENEQPDHPEKWGNLPGGEVFTTPGEVNGTFVIDGVVADYLCQKYDDLRHAPLTVRAVRNRLTEAYSDNKGSSASSGSTRTPIPTATGSASSPSAEHRAAGRHRPHPAGREIPRDPRCLRQPVRRPHGRDVALLHAHRRR